MGRAEGREERPDQREAGGFVVCRQWGLRLVQPFWLGG